MQQEPTEMWCCYVGVQWSADVCHVCRCEGSMVVTRRPYTMRMKQWQHALSEIRWDGSRCICKGIRETRYHESAG
jgi:hypothetical protein